MRKSFKTLVLLAITTVMAAGLRAQTPNHPTIGGAVYGGGRVANINGSTLVKIVNCESIDAVFGGNDIAGKVLSGTANALSFNGTEVVIGVADQSTQIRIGSVYGGGNGFYSYPDANNWHVKDSAGLKIRHYVTKSPIPTRAEGTTIANYYFTGGDTTTVVTVNSGDVLYVPQVERTRITVNTNIPVIDSLFGGAKNAFVNATTSNSTLITVNGGTIYSVFGGNNFGGSLGTGSNHTINIAGTKTVTNRANNPSDNLGTDHGIRYLFGGGNKVAGQNVVMNITGGQIDTCFAGGNSADVGTSVVTVNVTTPLYSLANSKYTDPVNYAYDIHQSVFDIRCLFGGNNKADMAHLPTITLTRGGIHNLYGGGNVGIMRGGIVGDANRSVCHYIDNDNREINSDVANRYLSTKIVISPTEDNNNYLVIDTVYGGGQSAGTLCDTYIEVAGGHVGTIFGGTNIRGSIGPDRAAAMKSNIWLHGGNIHESVFGGSNGYYRCMNNSGYLTGITNTVIPGATVPYNVAFSGSIPQIWQTSILMTGTTVVVSGNVYGGGNLAFVGRPNAEFGDAGASTKVRIMGGTVNNDVYGGGNFADVYGTADVHISTENSVTIGRNVYGGNDKTGRVTGYGRGAGSLSPYRTSTVRNTNFNRSDLDGTFWDNFNGEDKIDLTATNAAAYVLIEGTPTITGDVYGGGNGDYNYYRYNDGYTVERYYVGNVPSESGTWIEDGEGKMTWESGREEVLRCGSTSFPEAVSAFVDVHMDGNGSINRVFAGGNSASVSGQTTVNFNCTAIGASAQVGSIFGGNNKVDMAIVPRLLLQKGKVSKIYGGGNLGGMTGLRIANATNVSTYVGLVSPDVTVTNEIYGGCNAADVTNATFVKVARGTMNGNIFGGNDVAGHVNNSYVWINGLDASPAPRLTVSNMVFGGGNGDYTYVANGDLFNANGIIGVTGRPTVGSTHVTVNGNVELDNNLYGGGLAGDCTNTTVVLDAAEGIFNDIIFGGGRGDVANIGNKCPTYNGFEGGVTKSHVGNVTGTATINIVRMHDMHEYGVSRRRAIFGGGHAGDVANVELTLANTNTAHIPALYAGCLASNVTGTAHAVLNGYSRENNLTIVDTVYGGNDYSGKVQHTDLEINSGTYYHVFGAGNGAYTYKNDPQQAYVFSEETNTAAIDDPALRVTPPAGFSLPSGYQTTYGGHESTMVINTAVQPAETTYVHTYRYWRDVTCPGWQDTVPYSMVVDVTINGGHFIHNVYGGGNMGLVGDRDMDPTKMNNKTYADAHIGYITLNIHGGHFDHHVFTGARGMVAMTSQFFKGTSGWTNPVTGVAGQNVAGGKLYNQLAYAQKILNMDGGTVLFSVYGGSEAVDDGFPYECIGNEDVLYYNPTVTRPRYRYQTNSSLRPSSILNIVGGEIRKSVYGGGYQGNAYGSIYVNIGTHAVDDSPVWTNTYNYVEDIGTTPSEGAAFTLAAYKPVGLTASTADFEASIYNGSDWGEADDHAYFNTRGVFGGETNILIDGKDYNTSGINPELNDLPGMNIAFSIIGAGTSTEGGDIRRLITIRNYGYYDECGKTTKNLFSIQRADKVILDHVYITLEGEEDAFSAYASPNYSLCRLDTLMFYDDNVIFITAPGIFVGNMTSVKPFASYSGIRDLLDFTNIDHPSYLYNNARVAGGDGENMVSNDLLDNLLDQCEQNMCLKLPAERGGSEHIAAANTLVIKNGSYLRVAHFKDIKNNSTNADEMDGKDDEGTHWGRVFGWMYLLSDETQSYVYADYKTTSFNEGDGGFISPCTDENVAMEGFSSALKEIHYTNVFENSIPQYRTWRVGTTQGSRTRHITLVANVTPDNVLNYNLESGNYPIRLSNGTDSAGASINVPANSHLAYATTTLELPPAEGGNFYVISSVTIDQDNGEQMKLTDVAYDHSIGTNGAFFRPRDDGDVVLDLDAISRNGDDTNMRNYTFGLTFSTIGSTSNFEQSDCWMPSDVFTGNPNAGTVDANDPLSFHNIEIPTPHDIWQAVTTDAGGTPLTYKYFNCWPTTSISGNRWMNGVKGYISRAIKAGSGMIPTMEFTLTYDKRLTTTITRDVEFTMQEYDADGNWVGPVMVTVTIATVIKDFDNLEAPVLAMYNEGISNEYVRKVTIPASYKQRELYVTGVEWDLNTEGTAYQPEWFALQDSSRTIASNDVFSLILSPSESASENITNHLGWYNIDTTGIDLYNLALTDFISTYKDEENLPDDYDFPGNKLAKYSSDNPAVNSELEDFTEPTKLTRNGMLLGTLDGRSTASIDLTLKYNGDYVYHDCYPKPLGKIRVKMRWVNTKHTNDAGIADEGEFYLDIYLRTREAGDTIYLGPGTEMTRTPDGSGATPVTVHSFHHPANVAIHGSTRVQDIHHSYVTYPNCYVNTLQEALTVYWEGDVIAVMGTIPVNEAEKSVIAHGDDYSIIQIIRYSGSHYQFPSLGCAHTGPLFDVSAGNLNFRNIWINGSGCTRTKPLVSGTHGQDPYSVTACGTTGNYYLKDWRREQTILYSNGPVIYCHGSGKVNMSSNVRLSNNFNIVHNKTWNSGESRWDANGSAVCGGAIAIIKDGDGMPSVIVGNKSTFYDNLVVDWSSPDNDAATILGHLPEEPLNYGGAVYIDGGHMQLGTTIQTSENEINISRNYYLHSMSGENTGLIVKTKHMLGGAEDEVFNIYYLDTLKMTQSFALSNVYLMRTPYVCPSPMNTSTSSAAEAVARFQHVAPVRFDQKSSAVYFISDLSETSRIGISKWFPGYVYNNNSAHRLYNPDIPRDTIVVAMDLSGKNRISELNAQRGVFFNDSLYYSMANRPDVNDVTEIPSPRPDGFAGSTLEEYKAWLIAQGRCKDWTGAPSSDSIAFYTDRNLTTYHGNSVANPQYSDRVFIFQHANVSPRNIFFQRCGTFGKGKRHTLVESQYYTADPEHPTTLTYLDLVMGDSIAFRWNPDATCVASTDTILFFAGGGFFPYKYHWDYDSIVSDVTTVEGWRNMTLTRIPVRDRVSYGPNAIVGAGERNELLRRRAQRDTLVLRMLHQRQNQLKSTYLYTVTATDVTSNCEVVQPVMVRVGKITQEGRGSEFTHQHGAFYIDSSNFLRHRNPYAAYYNYNHPDSANTLAGIYTDFPVSNGVLGSTPDAFGSLRAGEAHDDGSISYPNARLFRQKLDEHGDPLYITPEGIETTEAAGNEPLSDYLYYRVSVPGVDSSSFHDHVELYPDKNYYALYGQYPFMNSDGEALYPWYAESGDTLVYLRWNGAGTPSTAEDYTNRSNFTNEGNCHRVRYVPFHTYSNDDAALALDGSPTNGGIRRAGFSHNPMHYYHAARNDGNTAERMAARTFSGQPYHDARYAITNASYVEYGTWTPVPAEEAPAPDLYSGEMVPRYLRVYEAFKVSPKILPESARGYVEMYPMYATSAMYDDPSNPSDPKKENVLSPYTEFCANSVIHLRPIVKDHDASLHPLTSKIPGLASSSDWEYVAWDFDPSGYDTISFVVGRTQEENEPTIYVAPKDYWWQVVTHHPGEGSYDRYYNGNVKIKDYRGLAWLISTVNGYNGQNAHTFRFDTVYLDFYHDIGGGTYVDTVNMAEHKWTPLGNLNNPFEGTILGITRNAAGDSIGVVPLEPGVEGFIPTVTNIIVNEPTLQLVGMFGYTNCATLSNFNMETPMLNGTSYVGSLISYADSATKVTNVNISHSILFGEHIMGGLAAHTRKMDIDVANVIEQRLKGNAVYAGGMIGLAENTTMSNWHAEVSFNNLSAIYVGPAAGKSESSTFDPAKTLLRSTFRNGYARIINDGMSRRVGGLVGYAEALNMNNCYVYGEAKGRDYVGGLAGYISSNVNISNCYYMNGLTESLWGYNVYANSVNKSTTFQGSGNHVLLTERVDGYNNMTRALNRWVKAQNDNTLMWWRSDLDWENSGYPIFGTPDMITVRDSMRTAVCDSLLWDGLPYTESGIYMFRVVDSTDYLDSTFILYLTVNYSERTDVSDTVRFGNDYEGYGFSLTSSEIEQLLSSQPRLPIQTLQRIDSLYTVNGCDSVVVLTLCILNINDDAPEVIQQLYDVKVYPNPTRSLVNVEGDGLRSVEVYDLTSRHLMTIQAEGDKVTFDLSNYTTGSYYIRVKTSHGTVVKKVIKK